MIPRGRKVITQAEIAERAGVALSTWRRRDAPGFHQRVHSLFEGRTLVYDLEQTLAYLDGKPIPALPASEHPDDLLGDKEVAALLGVAVSTVQAYHTQGYLSGTHPKDADGQDITSIRVTTRRDAEARRDALPEGHTAGHRGRPAGSAARDEVAELLRNGQVRTGADVAAAVGISVHYANRLLKELGRSTTRGRRLDRQPTGRKQRIAQVARLLEQADATPSFQQIADEIGVSKTEASHLVHAARAAQREQP
jgi:hypothetical protein